MSLGQDDRDPTGRFLRGLTLGALLGAIIAGSSIWSRARARRAGAAGPVVEPGPKPWPGARPTSDASAAADDPER